MPTNSELAALTAITRTLERQLSALDGPARVRVLTYLSGWIGSQTVPELPAIATPPAEDNVRPIAPPVAPPAEAPHGGY